MSCMVSHLNLSLAEQQVRTSPPHEEQQSALAQQSIQNVHELPRPAVSLPHVRPQPSQGPPSMSAPAPHIPLPPHNSAADTSAPQPRPGVPPGQQQPPVYSSQGALQQRPQPRRIPAPSGPPQSMQPLAGPPQQAPAYPGHPSGPQPPHAPQPPPQHPHQPQQQQQQQVVPVPARAAAPRHGQTKEQLQQQGPIHTPQPQMQPPLHLQGRGPRGASEAEWHQHQLQQQQQQQPPPQPGLDPRQAHRQPGPGPMNHVGPHQQHQETPRTLRPGLPAHAAGLQQQHSHGRSPVRGPPSVGHPHPAMMGGPGSANAQPSSGAPPPEPHHSGSSEGHGSSQAHAIAHLQHHQQEVQIIGPGAPHEQPPLQQPPPGSGGGPMPGQPGSVPGQFPPGRGLPGGAMPMLMYQQHMGMTIPGPPPAFVPNGGGPLQGSPPVFIGGPPPPYMGPMMPGMQAHPMSGAPGPQPQQPPPHAQPFNGPMGPQMVPPMPGLVPMQIPGGPMMQQQGKPVLAMGAASSRFAGPGPNGGSILGTTSRNTTTLRASAPSFVPGGFKPAAAELKALPGASS